MEMDKFQVFINPAEGRWCLNLDSASGDGEKRGQVRDI